MDVALDAIMPIPCTESHASPFHRDSKLAAYDSVVAWLARKHDILKHAAE
jgi:hypothetical protein